MRRPIKEFSMNTTSASRVEPPPAAIASARTLVWDAPVRVFHWLMVLSFLGAYITAESERWRLLHVTLGYTMAGLVAFRLVWGLIGTRHARFASFVRGPAAVMRYLRSLLSGRPQHHVGHNPAGALAIVALLALAVAVTLSGWATDAALGGHWLEDLHEGSAEFMLGLVVLHIAAVLVASWLHHENLIGAMVSGRKPGAPQDGVKRAWRGVAALMLVAVLGFWWSQWRTAPAATRAAVAAPTVTLHSADDAD
jgi:cytochrome b